MYTRKELGTLSARINEPRKFIQVITGPRQVGKTTLVTQLVKKISFSHWMVSADNIAAADNAWIKSTWDEARRRYAHLKEQQEFLLVIDEIQKIENWSEAVKKEWDADTLNSINIKLIILGSSRLLIQKGLTESLAGRFETLYLTHWAYSEMRDAFNWSMEKYIYFGGYPGTAQLIEDEARWKAYVRDSLIETSISKDVLMLTRVDKPALLKRLFELGCTYSSQIIALNKIQGELQEKGNITTLSNYLALLEGAGLLSGIEKYAGDIIRKRSSKPKFQVFNNALLTSQLHNNFLELKNSPQLWGRLAESAVGSHLLNCSMNKSFNLYYWNDNNNEVDYVIEKGNQLVAIEVKSGKKSVNKGLSVFDTIFNPDKIYTIGPDSFPMEEFLIEDPINLF